MTQTILSALLPVVFVVALGMLATKLRVVEKSAAPVFAEFVVRFALPIDIFAGVLKLSPAAIENGPYLLSMFLGLMVPYAIAFGIGKLMLRHSLGASAVLALVCAFPNMVYSGLPVLDAVVGPQGVLAVIVGNLVTSLVMIPLTLVLVQIGLGDGKAGQSAGALIFRSLIDAVRQPLVWLPIIGVILALSGVHTPKVFELSFNLIGEATAGVALFTLGVIIYGQPLRMNRDVAINVLMKNVGQAAILFALTVLFRIHGAPARELFLTGAIPTATAASMLALRYSTYADEAAASTMVSTVGSIVSITAAIVLAAHVG